jgi:hypothetical protein
MVELIKNKEATVYSQMDLWDSVAGTRFELVYAS